MDRAYEMPVKFQHANIFCRPSLLTAVWSRSTANITSIISRHSSVESRNSRSTSILHSTDSVDSTGRDFGITPVVKHI